MSANSIEISGFKEFAQKCENLPAVIMSELDEVAGFAAATWEQLAERAVPVDQGFLKQGISNVHVSQGNWEVISAKEYSAVMEWGTKTLVSVPSELQQYASSFKGLPTGGDAKKAIYAWVLRKGLPKAAQWPVFISIMKKGVRPRPFFFIQRPVVEQQFIKDCKQVLETER